MMQGGQPKAAGSGSRPSLESKSGKDGGVKIGGILFDAFFLDFL